MPRASLPSPVPAHGRIGGLKSRLLSRLLSRPSIRVTAAMLAALLALSACGAPPSGTSTLDAVRTTDTTAATSGWLHTDRGTIRNAANQAYVIKAANWFGLETDQCVPHGLWTIALNDGLKQIRSMGFNTIRLPYSNECITSGRVSTDTNFTANPDLRYKTPLQVMDLFIAKSKAAGLNVILDRHRPSSAAQSELWYTSAVPESKWISDWTMLAARYRNEPAVIGVDLHNEPHGAARWGGARPATDWHAAATRAGNAIQAVNPRLLVIIEGVEVSNDGSYTWWGGGLADVKARPVRLNVPNQVVYSPHDYPASVYPQKWFSAADYPANLPGIWDARWGYLAKEGIAPVLVGEFGTKLETASDRQWLSQFVKYMGSTGMSFAYWSFNPNSSDTGGLVRTDWRTPEAAKLEALKPLLGTPAPVAAPSPAPTATPSPPAAPAPSPSPSPSPSPAPSSPAPSPGSRITAKWSLQNSWSGGYTANITVTATDTVGSWSVTYADPNVTSVPNSWGAKCSFVAQKSITCVGADWASTLRKGQSVTVGLQVGAVKPPVAPAMTVAAR